MKCILKSDFNKFKRLLIKIFLFNFVSLILATILLSFNESLIENAYLNLISLNVVKNQTNLIEIALLIINFTCYIYLAYSLFINEIKNAPENIFLRMKSKEWIISKLISIAIYTLIFTIFRFIIFNICLITLSHELIIYPFINVYLYYLFISYLFILLISLINYKEILIPESYVILLLLIPKRIIKISIIYLIIGILLTVVLLYFKFKRHASYLLEMYK